MIDKGGTLELGVPESTEVPLGSLPDERYGRPETFAYLSQLDPMTGARGWDLFIQPWVWDASVGLRGRWVAGQGVRTPLQKPGIRLPTLQQRTDALQRLGFEAYKPEGWEWYESKFVLSELPYVYAVLSVRPIAAVTG